MSKKQFGIGGKGYYIALVLCAAAIGISGYVYYQNANRVQPVSMTEEHTEQILLGSQAETAAPAPRQETAPPETQPPRRVLKTAAPVPGDTITDYAMDCLSYNETTRDWRVHDGIDLAAPEGTQVTAAAEGTVYSAGRDDTLGYTVVIRHEGGYTTQYSNLRDDLAVSVGDWVALGDTIGYVGCSALLESAMDSHVHFCVTCQGKSMAPEAFFALE